MKKIPPLISEISVIILMFTFMSSRAQKLYQDQILIENSIQVSSTINEAWLVLSDFIGVGNFHVLYDESNAINKSAQFVALGDERESLMPDGNYNVILKERVIELVDGSHYTYEVFDSENISLESMQVTYGVRSDTEGNIEIYSKMAYDLGSGVKTNLSKRKFNRDNKISLLSYKYFIEKGEVEKDLKKLKKWAIETKDTSAQRDLIATRSLSVE